SRDLRRDEPEHAGRTHPLFRDRRRAEDQLLELRHPGRGDRSGGDVHAQRRIQGRPQRPRRAPRGPREQRGDQADWRLEDTGAEEALLTARCFCTAHSPSAGWLTLAAAPSLLEGARPPAALSGVVETRMVTVRRPGGAGRLLLLTALLGTAAYLWRTGADLRESPAPAPVPAAALAPAPARPPSPLLALPPPPMRDPLHPASRPEPDRP